MAVVITGYGMAVSLDTADDGNPTAIDGRITEAEINMECQTVESKGAGNEWKVRAAGKKDWDASVSYEFKDGTNFETNSAYLGADCYIAIKRKTGDTNPVFDHVGLCVENSVSGGADEPMAGTLKIVSSKGTAPGIDSSPESA